MSKRHLIRDNLTSLQFSSTSTYVSAANSASLDITSGGYAQSITVGAWVKYTGTTTGGATAYMPVVNKDSSGSSTREWQLAIRGDGLVRFLIFIGNSSFSAATTVGVPRGRWVHIAGRYDGANIQVFINGVLSATTAKTGNIDDDNAALQVGVLDTLSMVGRIDDVRLYNTALTDAQIETWYLNGELPTSNLKLSYDFNEGVGTSTTDQSGNSNTGTITGATYSTDVPYSARPLVRDNTSSLSFNGSSAYISVAQTSGLPAYTNTNFTISFYALNRDTTQLDKKLYSEGSSSSGTPVYLFGTGAGAGEGAWLRVFIRDDSNNILLNLNTSNVLKQGSWQHIALTDANGTVNVYVDGIKVATGSYTRGTLTLNRVGIAAQIQAGVSGYFNGLMDDVQILNTALTASQVRNLYLGSYAPSSRVAWFKLDESTGTSATDSSGNSNTGTITGATYSTDVPYSARPLLRDNASSLSFDGTDDVVTFTSAAAQNDLSTLTITGWIKARGQGESNAGRVLSKGSGLTSRYRLFVGNTNSINNRVAFIAQFGTNPGQWATDGGTLKIGEWIHIAVTYDASSLSNDAKFYINGVSMNVGEIQTPSGTLAADDTNMYIGNDSTGVRTFNGLIDEIRYYNRVLTAAEIRTLSLRGDVSSGLVGYWQFDENTGTTLTDSTGNANGTISGATWSTDVPFKGRTLI